MISLDIKVPRERQESRRILMLSNRSRGTLMSKLIILLRATSSRTHLKWTPLCHVTTFFVCSFISTLLLLHWDSIDQLNECLILLKKNIYICCVAWRYHRGLRMTITTFQMLCNKISPLVSYVMPSHSAVTWLFWCARRNLFSKCISMPHYSL